MLTTADLKPYVPEDHRLPKANKTKSQILSFGSDERKA